MTDFQLPYSYTLEGRIENLRTVLKDIEQALAKTEGKRSTLLLRRDTAQAQLVALLKEQEHGENG